MTSCLISKFASGAKYLSQNYINSKLFLKCHICNQANSCKYCSSSSSSSSDGNKSPSSTNTDLFSHENTGKNILFSKPKSDHHAIPKADPTITTASPISMKNMVTKRVQVKTPKSPPTPACATLVNRTPLSEHELGLQQQTEKATPRKSLDIKTIEDSFNLQDRAELKGPRREIKKCKHGLEILNEKDCFRRVHFAMKLLFMLEDEPDILDNILFTDECNFNLPKVSPNPLITKPSVAQSETLPQIAWCGATAQGCIGPYFFNSYVTDKTYLKMLEKYVLPELESKGYKLKDLWFQQDGASWHRSTKVLDFLKSVFDYRVISLGSTFTWPPRSQDLTPMDYFFWDHIKDRLNFKHSKYDLCFQKRFREILTEEVADVRWSTLRKAIHQLPERLEHCVNANGDRFYDVMFKINHPDSSSVSGPAPPPPDVISSSLFTVANSITEKPSKTSDDVDTPPDPSRNQK